MPRQYAMLCASQNVSPTPILTYLSDETTRLGGSELKRFYYCQSTEYADNHPIVLSIGFGQMAFRSMQSRCLLTISRLAKALTCGLCLIVCLANPSFACSSDRSSDQSQLTQIAVSHSADRWCETAECQSTLQNSRWNVKPAFLSRSMVAVLHQRGLSEITHPAGKLHREFSQPSLFDMGIALRL